MIKKIFSVYNKSLFLFIKESYLLEKVITIIVENSEMNDLNKLYIILGNGDAISKSTEFLKN